MLDRLVRVPRAYYNKKARLSTKYTSNNNVTPLSSGDAAVRAAKITEAAKAITYRKFRSSPIMPNDYTVADFFKKTLSSLMAGQRGTAVEFLGLNYDVGNNLDYLIKNERSDDITGFSGAIIHYDLNYRWTAGNRFENGRLKYRDAAITSKLALLSPGKRSPLFLSTVERGMTGRLQVHNERYLFTPSAQANSTSGESGDESTSDGGTLSDVVIRPPPGGGGGYGGNPPPPPPTDPPPGGGGEAGNSVPGINVSTEPQGNNSSQDWSSPFNIYIGQSSLPSWSALDSAFPNSSADAVYNLVGGHVKDLHNFYPTKYGNACALRLSRALNYSGKEIPLIQGVTEKGADNKNYILSLDRMYVYLKKAFGNPTVELSNPTPAQGQSAINSGKGIYIMRPNYPGEAYFNATGHGTLFNNGSVKDHTYFDAKGGVNTISLWKTQ